MLWWKAQLFQHTNNLHSAAAKEANHLKSSPCQADFKVLLQNWLYSFYHIFSSFPCTLWSLMVLRVSYSSFLLGYFKGGIREWVLSTDSRAHRRRLTWQAAFLAYKIEVKISLWSSLLVFCSLHRSLAVAIVLVAWNKAILFWFWIKTIIP